ncbi:MAG TPA: hypothetical protein VF006_07700 [Longimicrobium sp.]
MDRDKPARSVEAEDFASRCDELLGEVEQRGGEILITRGGAVIARLIPFATELRPFVGRSDGTINLPPGDLLAPIGKDWEVDQDL